MEDERSIELSRIRNQVLANFRNRQLLPRKLWSPTLQYLILPTWQDWVALDVVDAGVELGLFKSRWSYLSDLKAFANPVERNKHPRPFVPTLSSERLEVSQNALRECFALLTETAVPITPGEYRLGLDGIGFELNNQWATLRWHMELPPGWRELEPGIRLLEDLGGLNSEVTESERPD